MKSHFARTGAIEEAIAPTSRLGLQDRVLRGGAWLLGADLANRALGLAKITILARLLAPRDFGLMGMAVLVLSWYTLTPRTVPLGRLDGIRRLNETWYVAAIEAAQRGLGGRSPLYWVSYFEGCFSLIEKLKHSAYVYHCLDFLPFAEAIQVFAHLEQPGVALFWAAGVAQDGRNERNGPNGSGWEYIRYWPGSQKGNPG